MSAKQIDKLDPIKMRDEAMARLHGMRDALARRKGAQVSYVGVPAGFETWTIRRVCDLDREGKIPARGAAKLAELTEARGWFRCPPEVRATTERPGKGAVYVWAPLEVVQQEAADLASYIREKKAAALGRYRDEVSKVAGRYGGAVTGEPVQMRGTSTEIRAADARG